MTYKEARVYLDNLSKYGSVLGLGTIQKLLCELGNPQDDLKFIHIAGTNGKGSVLAYTSTILSKAGCKVGRYVSPTVISYLERIQVDGMWISEDAFARLTARVREAIARMESAGEKSPTVFEIETAIAFLYFKEQDCDLVVLECGLGGETDATNIVENTLVAVFTPISRDHTGILGDTPGEIAAVKAGIIKPGCIVVTSAQEPEVMQVLRDRAGQLDCPLHVTRQEQLEILDDRYLGQIISYKGTDSVYLPLAGAHQSENAMTALETIFALESLGYPISKDAVRQGFQSTIWPGRFSCLRRDPLFFIDGAHNEAAAERLRENLENYFPGKRIHYIMGVFKDKDYEKIAGIMAPLACSVHTVDLPLKDRTLPATELASVMKEYCNPNTSIHAEPDIESAVRNTLKEADKDDVILAFGSLSYLGQIMDHIF
ncbi:MAG: bifunctional folylpolyglutamate synthase/dihydrofolate synthase [Dorea sp.]|nr:bifunctional folylpolyglutamate synthase/dihydrofolate synthase [Dorea sp.]